jgi:hypothetical protein
MRTLDDVARDLSCIALDLAEASDDTGLALEERHRVLAASAQCASAVIILDATLARIRASRRAAEFSALAEICRCGHDRGDHLVELPHACEHTGESESSDDGATLLDPCSCRRFETGALSLIDAAPVGTWQRVSTFRNAGIGVSDTIPTRDDSATERPGDPAATH